MIELKHLRVLQEISHHGSMSAAARALGYSQPAISQQIKRLEHVVQVPVLVRSSTGIRLTEAGEILRRHGSAILMALSLAEAEVGAVTGLRAGNVRVVSFPSAAASLLASAMSSLVANYPGIKFGLTEAGPSEALDMLKRGECDIALVFNYATAEPPDISDGLVAYPLLDEAVQVVLSETHPLARQGTIALEELADARWIAGCPRCRGHLLAACEAAGFVPDIAYETDDYVALQSLAARGLGVALLPDLILSVVRLPGLVVKPLDPPTGRRINAVSTPDLIRMPAVAATLAALRRSATSVLPGRLDLAPGHAGALDDVPAPKPRIADVSAR